MTKEQEEWGPWLDAEKTLPSVGDYIQGKIFGHFCNDFLGVVEGRVLDIGRDFIAFGPDCDINDGIMKYWRRRITRSFRSLQAIVSAPEVLPVLEDA